MNNQHLTAAALSLLAVLAPGCTAGGAATEVETIAPLCGDLAGANPKELFPVAVVPADRIKESLIFGGMDPGTLEPINFELGFMLNDRNVPVTAPADLYVRSIEVTRFLVGSRAGEHDYALSFDVCSREVDGEIVRAVEGDLAHVTSFAPAYQQLLEGSEQECYTNAGPEETVETCRMFLPASVDDGLVIPAGTVIGSAGGTGATAYAPGLDLNLLDARYPNNYVNPDRIGSEDGPGRAFRYGACVYEYFAAPHRAAYMAKVGQNGDLRVDADAPCGTMSFGSVGTPAGIWIRADHAALDINQDLEGVLSNLLVLGPHPVFPGSRQVVSTELTALASGDNGGMLVEFEPAGSGDVNLNFYDMVPGSIYCIDAMGFGMPVPHHYYLELGAGKDTLKIERLAGSCAAQPVASRTFSAAAIDFVR